MLEMVLSIVRIGAAVYVGLCLVVFFRQGSYVYYPDRNVGLTPGYFNMPYEDIRLTAQDGETIAAWFVPSVAPASGAMEGKPVFGEQKSRGTVLFCHGNGGNIGDWLDSVITFHNMGLDVLIFDYRGYGDSSGRPTEKGTYLDALAAWQYLTEEKGVSTNSIVIFGRSLGGSVAVWLAEKVKPGALVIESTFTSAPDMASRMFPYLPIRFFCRFKYDSLTLIGKVGCPVLIAHSRDDEMIPYKHGQRLFESASEPKRFVEMRGGHNSGGLDADTRYQEILDQFLTTHLEKNASR